MSKITRGFASDNNAGVHPLVMDAIQKVNLGHEVGYGDDPYTQRALTLMKKELGENADIYLVFTGTAANVLGIGKGISTFQSIICADTAHIHVDECGAPEKYTGSKLLSCATPDGKLTKKMISAHLHGIGFEHHVQPGIVSITQATEMGTLYSLEEIRSLADFVHEKGMLLHMDGARISNAAVALACSYREMTAEAGVDILSFGGTKNGLMYGEAIVFFDPQISRDFKYHRKQGMQLASKMRYMGAQFSAYLEEGLWQQNAAHANRMAAELYEAVKDIPGVEITQQVQSNAVFAIIPPHVTEALQKEYFFYVWDEDRSEVRWMCSWDTSSEDVQDFAATLRRLIG